MFLALSIAILFGSAIYLVQQRGMVRMVLGMTLLGHAVNLTILSTGVYSYRGEVFPSRTDVDAMADPIPQAFVLTAIVISMATATIMLTMAALGKDDDTDVPEPVDDNTIDHTMTTLGRVALTQQGTMASDEHLTGMVEGHPDDSDPDAPDAPGAGGTNPDDDAAGDDAFDDDEDAAEFKDEYAGDPVMDNTNHDPLVDQLFRVERAHSAKRAHSAEREESVAKETPANPARKEGER